MNRSTFAAMAAILLASAAAAPVSAAGQEPSPILAALKRHFPAEHTELSASLAGKPAAEARGLVYGAMQRFQRAHADEILAAPGGSLVALEASNAKLLQSIAERDSALCAKIGDRGFWGPEALAAAPPPGIEQYGAELIEAAAAGKGRPGPGEADVGEMNDWIAASEKLAPGAQIEVLLTDPEARSKASPERLCTGMIAMHKAIAGLPPEQGARISALALGSLLMIEP